MIAHAPVLLLNNLCGHSMSYTLKSTHDNGEPPYIFRAKKPHGQSLSHKLYFRPSHTRLTQTRSNCLYASSLIWAFFPPRNFQISILMAALNPLAHLCLRIFFCLSFQRLFFCPEDVAVAAAFDLWPFGCQRGMPRGFLPQWNCDQWGKLLVQNAASAKCETE